MESHILKLVIFSQPILFRIDTNIAFQKVGILFVYVRTVLLNYCAAEFKYGKKNLSELISMIQDYHVKENDENLITCRIEMQGEHRAIKYTGKHFWALQKAIGFYSDDAK